jgi:hypothetical protein
VAAIWSGAAAWTSGSTSAMKPTTVTAPPSTSRSIWIIPARDSERERGRSWISHSISAAPARIT